MRISNSSRFLTCLTIFYALCCVGCVAQRNSTTAKTGCYHDGISVVTGKMGWEKRDVFVSPKGVEFNYYASLFADTLSQITGTQIDSFVLFSPNITDLGHKISDMSKNQSRHSLFLSTPKDNYYFIEQVADYTADDRPTFGEGTVYLLKCENGVTQILFSKDISYN